ncbi:MAG: PAS domain S-box protein [Dehalococcoidia bacterium]|nr:PAS domain S-box protein [Dehalococcoidia bacterium]
MTQRRQPNRPTERRGDSLRSLLRSLPIPALAVSPEGRIVAANTAVSRLLAYGQRDLPGRQLRDLCADKAGWLFIERRLQRERSFKDRRLRLCRKDGSHVECLAAASPIEQVGDRTWLCLFSNLTPYAERIRELETASQRLGHFVNMEKDSLWTSEFQPDGSVRVTYMSEPIANAMGYTAEQLKSMTLDEMLMPSSAKVGAESYRRQLRIDGRPGIDPARSWTIELELRHKDGHPVWVETKSTFMRDKQGKPIGIIGFTRDITERRRYEEQLKALSSSLVEMQETERRHIARELHDQIGQSLTGIRMLLGMLPEGLPRNGAGNVREIQCVIDDIMTRVKDLCLELRPSTLDDLGLLPTLLRHFQSYKTQTGVTVHFKQKGLEKRFDPAIETAVFRIVQESLTNVARHAKVSDVNVRIIVTRKKIALQIEDNGQGFVHERMYARSNATGTVGMQERASLVGGHLSVESVPGVGTRVIAELPARGPVEARTGE